MQAGVREVCTVVARLCLKVSCAGDLHNSAGILPIPSIHSICRNKNNISCRGSSCTIMFCHEKMTIRKKRKQVLFVYSTKAFLHHQ